MVLACRSLERGEKLQGELQKEAAALGHADAKVEASAAPDAAACFMLRCTEPWTIELDQLPVGVCVVSFMHSRSGQAGCM